MTQPQTYVTDAVVLRLIDHGESDRVAILLTEREGKVSAIAKGARSSRRRFGAALSPFGHGEASLRTRRGSDLLILESLHSARGFPHLSQELSRFAHASYVCELVNELCPPHKAEPQVLRLLLHMLDHLDRLPLSERPGAEALRAFELHLLSFVGFGLALDRCAACGAQVSSEDMLPFDPLRGGVLCLGCQHGNAAQAIRKEVRQALVALSQHEPASAGELALGRDTMRACRDLLLSVLRSHLGHNLRAVEFIAKLNLAVNDREDAWPAISIPNQ